MADYRREGPKMGENRQKCRIFGPQRMCAWPFLSEFPPTTWRPKWRLLNGKRGQNGGLSAGGTENGRKSAKMPDFWAAAHVCMAVSVGVPSDDMAAKMAAF